MSIGSVSPKFQIVIPKPIRRSHGIQPGQKIQFIDLGDRIVMVPLLEPKDLRGALRSTTPFQRDPDRDIGSLETARGYPSRALSDD